MRPTSLAISLHMKIPASDTPATAAKTHRALLREDLVRMVETALDRHKVMTITARAGQGKSVLARQVAARSRRPVLWVQCRHEDSRSQELSSSLEHALLAIAPATLPLMPRGMPSAPRAPDQYAQAFCAALTAAAPGGALLILDDVHLAAAGPESSALLLRIMEHGAGNGAVLCLARHLPRNLSTALDAMGCAALNNDRLALNVEEILLLYNNIYGIPLSLKNACLLHRVIQGWTMGAVLARIRLANAAPDQDLEEDHFLTTELWRYFHDSFLGGMKSEDRKFMQALALIATVPNQLAAHLAPSRPSLDALEELVAQDLFVRRHPHDNSYLFHRLLGSIFRKFRAAGTPPECIDVLQRASLWFESRNQWLDALRCLALGANADATDDFFRRNLHTVLSCHQTASTAHWLHVLDAPDTPRRPWLALARSIFRPAESRSDHVRHSLDCAARGFAATGNHLGELQAWLMMSRKAAFGDTGLPRPTLIMNRIKTLTHRCAASMDKIDQTVVSLARAYHAVLVGVNPLAARSVLLPLLDNEACRRITSIRAETLALLSITDTMLGRHQEAEIFLEQVAPLLEDPDLTAWSRTIAELALAADLALTGHHPAMHSVTRRILDSHPLPGDYPLIEPMVRAWSVLALVQKDRLSEAEHMVRDCLANGNITVVQREYRVLLAYVLAVRGCRAEALQLLSPDYGRDLEFPLLRSNRNLLIAAVFILTGQSETGVPMLLELHRASDTNPIQAEGAAWFLALHASSQHDADSCGSWLQSALRLSRARKAVHMAWSPCWGRHLLATAVDNGIETEHASRLARKLCGLELRRGKKPWPTLHIHCLGELEIRVGEAPPYRLESLPPTQRHLLGLLLARPTLSLSLQEAMLELWPDSSAESARACFDTALLRLRQALASTGATTGGKALFEVRGGILSMRHVVVDAWSFLRLADAIKAAGDDRPCRTGRLFHQAMTLWRAGPAPAMLDLAPLRPLAEQLRVACADITHMHARHLLRRQLTTDLIQTLEIGHKARPTHPELTRMLYDAASLQGDFARAEQAVADYRRALIALGMDAESAYRASLSLF